MESDVADLAQQLLRLVLDDAELPSEVRSQAAQLRTMARQQPELALERLDEIATTHATNAAHESPPSALAKALTVEAFWEHYLADEVKAMFPVPESYRRYLAAAPDPAASALQDLKSDGVLIPAPHSWLAPYPDIEPLTSIELVDRLELAADRRPPLLIVVLQAHGLEDHGVAVRSPRATDAARSRQPQWRASGLASGIPEFIDRDIPAEVVEVVAWRP